MISLAILFLFLAGCASNLDVDKVDTNIDKDSGLADTDDDFSQDLGDISGDVDTTELDSIDADLNKVLEDEDLSSDDLTDSDFSLN